jgi:hypothetical protein
MGFLWDSFDKNKAKTGIKLACNRIGWVEPSFAHPCHCKSPLSSPSFSSLLLCGVIPMGFRGCVVAKEATGEREADALHLTRRLMKNKKMALIDKQQREIAALCTSTPPSPPLPSSSSSLPQTMPIQITTAAASISTALRAVPAVVKWHLCHAGLSPSPSQAPNTSQTRRRPLLRDSPLHHL